jgi:hypothetical protein
MRVSRPHGSGTIIVITWARLRPDRWSSSSTLSKIAVSDPSTSTAGSTLARSSPKTSDRNVDWRANIQFTFPRSVLISPLWLM